MVAEWGYQNPKQRHTQQCMHWCPQNTSNTLLRGGDGGWDGVQVHPLHRRTQRGRHTLPAHRDIQHTTCSSGLSLRKCTWLYSRSFSPSATLEKPYLRCATGKHHIGQQREAWWRCGGESGGGGGPPEAGDQKRVRHLTTFLNNHPNGRGLRHDTTTQRPAVTLSKGPTPQQSVRAHTRAGSRWWGPRGGACGLGEIYGGDGRGAPAPQ